jgi:hypothetical protein
LRSGGIHCGLHIRAEIVMRLNLRSTRGVGALLMAPLLAQCFGGGDLTAAEWRGPPFSAEIFSARDSTKPSTRIYMGTGKFRLEMGKPDDRSAIVFDPARGTTLLIGMKDRSYIDAGMFTSLIARGAAPVMRLLRPMNAVDPCTDWNSVIDHMSVGHDSLTLHLRSSDTVHPFICRHIGAESVNGRPAQKWAVAQGDHGDSGTLWIDDGLHIISKSASPSGEIELRDIEEGPQPAALFEPPPGYRRLGLSEMLAKLRNPTATN